MFDLKGPLLSLKFRLQDLLPHDRSMVLLVFVGSALLLWTGSGLSGFATAVAYCGLAYVVISAIIGLALHVRGELQPAPLPEFTVAKLVCPLMPTHDFPVVQKMLEAEMGKRGSCASRYISKAIGEKKGTVTDLLERLLSCGKRREDES